MKRAAEHNAKIGAAQKGRIKEWKIKSCGKAHPYCKECRPGIAEKISTAQFGVLAPQRGRVCQPGCSCSRHQKIDRPWCRKPKPDRKKPTCSSCGGSHNFTKACAPKTVAKRTRKTKQTLKKQGKTGTAQGYRWTAEQRKHRSDAYYSSPAHQAQLKEAGKEGRRQARLRKPTSLENILHHLLLSCGWEIRCEERFDPYCVDVYIPSLHLAFEADGYYWHKSRQARYRDRKRDRYLLERYNLPVVRLSEEDLARVDLGTTIG